MMINCDYDYFTLAQCYPNENEITLENLKVKRKQNLDDQEPIVTVIRTNMVSGLH